MNIFDQLLEAADSSAQLNAFLATNIQLLFDFENSTYAEVSQSRESFEAFIHKKAHLFRELDYELSHNKAFIIILFELCERFGTDIIIRIHDIIDRHKLVIGKRLEAAGLYLLHLKKNSDLIDRFDSICIYLQQALEEEEMDDRKIIFTFLNYFSKVLLDTSKEYVFQLIDKIKTARAVGIYPFLDNKYCSRIIEMDLQNKGNAYSQIQRLIEILFERDIRVIPRLDDTAAVILIEVDSAYRDRIRMASPNFNDIRDVSSDRYIELNDNSHFFALRRGVKVIDDENQLFAYMHGLGRMHNHKIRTALASLPATLFREGVGLVDWGCGQGLASMAYLEQQSIIGARVGVNRVILIEPSKIALKRAALHVQRFDELTEIVTVNKYIHQLSKSDFPDSSYPTVHLFSNILDIEHISLSGVSQQIVNSFIGSNYFVCVSPLITDITTARIESFAKCFRGKQDFASYLSFRGKKGEWVNEWTIVAEVWGCKLDGVDK